MGSFRILLVEQRDLYYARVMTKSFKIAFILLTVIIELILARPKINLAICNGSKIKEDQLQNFQVYCKQNQEEIIASDFSFRTLLNSREDATQIGILPFPQAFQPYRQTKIKSKRIEDGDLTSTLHVLRAKLLDEAARFEAAYANKHDQSSDFALVDAKSTANEDFLNNVQSNPPPDAATLNLLSRILSEDPIFQ